LLKNICEFDTSQVYIYSGKDKILACGIENHTILQYDADQFYSPYKKKGSYEYYWSMNSLLIYNNKKLVAEFPITSSPHIAGNKVYSIKKNVLCETDISSVIIETNKNVAH
jgi:hypothetical protein